MITRANPQISRYQIVRGYDDPEERYFDPFDHSFFFVVRADFINAAGELSVMTPEYGSLSFESITRLDNKDTKEKVVMTPCTEQQVEHLRSGAQANEQLNFQDYMCVPDDFHMHLGGNYYDSSAIFSYAKLKIRACWPSETLVCAEGDDLLRFRASGKVKIIYKDLQSDLNNINTIENEPFRQRTEFDYFLPLSPISESKANVFIS